jgi:hypothetical protein
MNGIDGHVAMEYGRTASQLETRASRGGRWVARLGYLVATGLAMGVSIARGAGNAGDFDPAEGWSFSPPADTFSPQALFDLRDLNEKTAGEHGFIKLSADGMSLAGEDGTPIRFWGGSDYNQGSTWSDGLKPDELRRHARFLAKRGVNVVRFHNSLEPKNEGSAITDVDEKMLDQAFKLVAAMKPEGIYTVISPYWGESAKVLKSWHVPSAGGTDSAAGLLFFDETLQKGYKAWLKALYTRKNPYTGAALNNDPAVAIIQLQNEDSLLFWTAQNIKGEQLLALRRKFGAFLQQKYGASNRLPAAWNGATVPEDDWAHDLPGMQIIWFFTRDAKAQTNAAMQTRLADQFEFTVKVMRDFNAEMGRYLREELGCRQLINDGNWRAADQVVMDDAERWSYTAGEVIAKNHYFEAIHKGPNVGWQIIKDQLITNASALKDPVNWPMNVRQVQGKPFMITESLWVPPDLYQAEAPLMVAAQSCLTGLDTFFWFSNSALEWETSAQAKWTYATPMTLGQFPAAAWIFRKGLVQEAPPVVVEEKALADVWGRRMPLVAEGNAWDPNRDQGDLPRASSVKTTVDPLAFVAGPVWVDFGGDPAKSRVTDLSRLVDRTTQVVRAATGEIETDYGRGLYRVHAPQAQGAAGFLGAAGPQELRDVTIALGNAYGAVTVVSMDGKPIAESAKVLVQVATVARPQGWQVKAEKFDNDGAAVEGWRIVDAGKMPWRVEKAQGTVTVRNGNLHKGTVLDPNGMTRGAAETRSENGRLTLILPADALYVVLE